MPLPRTAGLALLLSTAAVCAQADIAGQPAAPAAAPAAAETPASAPPAAAAAAPAAEDAPDASGVVEHRPAAPKAAAAKTPSAAATAAAAAAAPEDPNGPTDPPPVSQLFPAAGSEEPPADMSQNVTINLLKIFVQKGYLSQMEAVGLIRQAENEALAARKTAKAKKDAEAAEEAEAMQVSYVPEKVKKEMREEIRNQVLRDLQVQAPSNGKNPASPAYAGPLPEKEDNFTLFGDIRLRYELTQFPGGNDNTGSFPNFNAINTGSPFDTAGNVFSPQRNVDQDRQRFRLRVRVGGEWQMTDGWSVGIRAATGDSNSPVSTNQSLGAGGGNFSKYAIWLDRAFIKYHTDFGGSPVEMDVLGGRFDSPFMATEAIFDDDLGFDGLTVKMKGSVGRFTPFLTAGAFPIYNTDFNFSSNQPSKFDSTDKYLLAAQLGTDIKLTDTLKLKLGVAYYNFDKVQGELSDPFIPLTSSDAGNTDNTRPSFAQYGNTYRPLRQIIPDATNNYGTSNQYQYFGLASKFTPVVISGKMEYSGFEPAMIAVYGEYIKNTAFNANEVGQVAVNNRGPISSNGDLGAFQGDDTAWIAGLKFGKTAMSKRGDWTVGTSYRWIGSDAVVDGFNDSDFGGGGTNVKGWTLAGSYSLTSNASIGLTWFSSDQIAGPPLSSDILMLDFKMKF